MVLLGPYSLYKERAYEDRSKVLRFRLKIKPEN